MQVTPSGERPFPTPPTPNAPNLESARFANRDTVVLPDEMVIKILMNLGTTDIAVCRRVNSHWQTLIDTSHLLVRSFYRDCHLTPRIDALAAQRNRTVERYHSHIRDWLTNFGNSGRETAEQLDNILGDVHFPEALFFSIPKLLLNTNELTYQNIATIEYSNVVNDARFSPDGKHFVTVCDGASVKIWWLEGGKWQEKVSIGHSGRIVSNAQFSPDGKHLVSTSVNGTVKIWELDDGQWVLKFTIGHASPVIDARLSPDGKHLVTLTNDHRIDNVIFWELVDVQLQEVTIQQWEEKATIEHSDIVNDVHFSLDGKHLVTASRDGTVKICGLEGRNWQVKTTIWHLGSVANASFSCDGKFLVTASHDDTAKICRLEGGRWQEIVTIQHSRAVTNASFGPDYQIVTASHDGTPQSLGVK